MKEDFLYYLWENRLFTKELETITKQPVQVITTGYRNTNSGPDFMEAKIKIGEQVWAGQVEIHVKTSDWNRHGHQYDKAYGNVVLHVVYENDVWVNNIPVVALKGHFDETLYHSYQRLVESKRWIACERDMGKVQPYTLLSMLDRMAIERIAVKSEAVSRLLNASKFDWEGTFYQLVLRYFGLKVNSEASEYLSHILPLKTLLKHADNLTQIEAMLFGCAGFLTKDFTEEYPQLLKREFSVMRAKFGLLTMPEERWKFMRMRPVNFPTIRIAQIAQLIHKNGCMFAKIREADTIEQIRTLFDVKASAYWDTHYRFPTTTNTIGPSRQDKQKPNQNDSPTAKRIGDGTIDVLIINAVIPLLFCYGKYHKDERYCEQALRFWESTNAEDNTVVRDFARNGITATNAMQSQALLHLYNHYCKRKRCLECSIGNVILH